jgi:hypothetical protein
VGLSGAKMAQEGLKMHSVFANHFSTTTISNNHTAKTKPLEPGHDYYSIWFNFSAAFFISEKKAVVIKLKTHYFISYHFMKC